MISTRLLNGLLCTSLLAAGPPAAWRAGAQDPPRARKVVEFVYTDLNAARPHVDRFVEESGNEAHARVVIIGYSARVSTYYKGYSGGAAAASQARFLLTARRDGGGADPARVRVVDGGLRDSETVEMYVVPRGAPEPAPSPSYPASAAVRCPRVRVETPPHVWAAGEALSFRAALGDIPPGRRPSFSWTVSAGAVAAGQGTPRVTVAPPGGAYRPLTATVEVGGFPRECEARAAATSPELMSVPFRFDEFGPIACGDELARLDNLLYSLRSDERLRAYVVVRGGGGGAARARATRMKSYLVLRRGMSFERVVAVAVDDGRADLRGELWLVPRGGRTPVDEATRRAGEVLARRGPRRPPDCEDSYNVSGGRPPGPSFAKR